MSQTACSECQLVTDTYMLPKDCGHRYCNTCFDKHATACALCVKPAQPPPPPQPPPIASCMWLERAYYAVFGKPTLTSDVLSIMASEEEADKLFLCYGYTLDDLRGHKFDAIFLQTIVLRLPHMIHFYDTKQLDVLFKSFLPRAKENLFPSTPVAEILAFPLTSGQYRQAGIDIDVLLKRGMSPKQFCKFAARMKQHATWRRDLGLADRHKESLGADNRNTDGKDKSAKQMAVMWSAL
jgi:hypothetical protein